MSFFTPKFGIYGVLTLFGPKRTKIIWNI